MDIPSHFNTISDFRMEPLNSDRLLKFYDRMGFRDLKRRVTSRINSAQKLKPKPQFTSRLGQTYDAMFEGKKDVEDAKSNPPQRIPPKAAEPKIRTEGVGDSNNLGNETRTLDQNELNDQLETEGQFGGQTQFIAPPDESDFDDVPF